MDRLKEARIKTSLKDIILGYSIVNAEGHAPIYAKHFSIFDSAVVEQKYEEAFTQAIERKLPTNQEQIEIAIVNGEWTTYNEKRLKDIPEEIQLLRLTKSKTILKREVEQLNKSIEAKEKEFIELEMQKQLLIGYSAEIFAAKKMNEYFVYFAFRRKGLEDFYFTLKEFDNLDESELNSLVSVHNSYAKRFDNLEMKKIAISNTFLNMISVSGDDIYNFYGKPVVDLTHRQMDIYMLGRQYINLLRECNGNIPKDFENDPDKLVDFVENKKNTDEFNKTNAKEESSGVAIVGATKEDIQNMGLDKEAGATTLQAEAAKHGKKSLTMDELIKLHGL